jgi:hypothetical protein
MDGGAGFLALLLKETKVGCMATTIKEKRVVVNRFGRLEIREE